MEEQIFKGRCASGGLSQGRIALYLAKPGVYISSGAPEEEHRRLKSALETTQSQLMSLKTKADQFGGQLLEFQLELLCDRHLTNPVFARINNNHSACDAWCQVLDAQISDYQTSQDEMFRSRAYDFIDLRDRVVSILQPESQMLSENVEGVIYVAKELTPSRFLEIDWHRVCGIALGRGSAASHVAMLARARGISMIFGLGSQLLACEQGAEALLHADSGNLYQYPGSRTIRTFKGMIEKDKTDDLHQQNHLCQPAVTVSGQRITIYLNIDDPTLLEGVDPDICDGIGLVRTEMMFSQFTQLPDEETQYEAYCHLLAWAGSRPVTIRTFDAGADKPMFGMKMENDTNPFMGLRGIRLALRHPDMLRAQLRALARASVKGDLKILLPMVTDPAEVNQTRQMLISEVQNLQQQGVAANVPLLGMMVEVPAAALRIHAFKADFFSIGTNDLIQFVTGASRNNLDMAYLQDPSNPAITELIRRVCAYGVAVGKEVSLCGDMATVSEQIPISLNAGIKILSVSASAVAAVKTAVSQWRKM